MQGKFQLEVFQDCGHSVQEDVPQLLATSLKDFWKVDSTHHRLPTAHDCPSWNRESFAPPDVPAPSVKVECAFSACDAREKIVSQCEGCKLQFCLKHRHMPDHACLSIQKGVDAEVERKAAIKGFVVKSLRGATTAAASPERPVVVGRVKKLNPAIELIKMKAKAQDWMVGKLIDKIAAVGKIANDNNVGGKTRLSLCIADSGEMLSPSSTLKELIEKKTLQSGGAVMLDRGD
ncbi:hypothetical protein HK101_007888 [Irineochytrium annulatum]|nr:hypothetical protein HK101_007888 [Irineochytrium annulatum]